MCKLARNQWLRAQFLSPKNVHAGSKRRLPWSSQATQATSLTTIKWLIPVNDVTTFSLTSDKLGRTDVMEHDVNVGDAPPIRQQPYRVPLPMWDTMERELDKMLKLGVIQPSSSPWASPVVLVEKKMVMCVSVWIFASWIKWKYLMPIQCLE